jgi:signal transduction histidine kinase
VIKGKVSKKLFVDSHRIMQVISNLLINAIKYSPGAEKIIVTLSQDEKEVLITVRDFGIGIAEDKVEYIFDRFFRSDGMRKKGISGLGLGLYISNEIIKRHGGKIWVKSKLNKGTAMSVSLPVTMRLKKQAL